MIGIDDGGAKVQTWRFQYIDEARQKLKNQVRIYYKYSDEIAAMESYACTDFGFNQTCSYVELYNEGKDEYHCKYWYLYDVRKVGLE